MELTWNLWLGGWNHEKSILLSFIYRVLTSSLSDFELVSCTEMNIILIRCFCRVPFWVQRLGDILWTIDIRSLRDPKTLGYSADHEVHPQTWHRTSKDSVTFRDYEPWWYKMLRKAISAVVTCEVQRDLLGWFRGTYLTMSFFGWRVRWWNHATSCACVAFQSTTARRCLQRSLWSRQVWVMESWSHGTDASS